MWRVALLGLCGAIGPLITAAAGISQENTVPEKPKVQRFDAEGFALPAGAVARLGTLRGVDDKTIEFLALSADGKKVASLAHEPNPTLRIREVPSGKLLQEVSIKIKYFWEGVALSPDFQKLAWTDLDDSVTLVELATGKETVLNAPTEDVRRAVVSFSGDGKKVCVTFSHHYSTTMPMKKGGSDRWVSMFDFEIVEWTLEDGKKRQLWKGAKDDFTYHAVAFAPDGKSLAFIKKKSAERVADFEQEFVLEDPGSRKLRLKVPLKVGSDCLMEFSPDGNLLALADEDSLHVVDLAQGKIRFTRSWKEKLQRPAPRWSFSSREPWPRKIVWLSGGDVGVLVQIGDLWTWKTADGTPGSRYASQATWPLAFAKNAPVLAFTQDGRALQFFDTVQGKPLQPVEGHRNPPSVLFRNDGSLISHDERKVCLWTAGDRRLRASFEFHDKGQRFYFGPSQDFFVRAVGTKVETRSLASGDVVKEWTLRSAPDFVFLLADGKNLAAGNLYEEPELKGAERMFVRILDVSSGAQREIALPYQPWQVRLAPAQALFALRNRADSRDYVDILDIASGKLQRLIDDKTVYVSLLDFASDGRRLYFVSWPTDSPRIRASLASVELAGGKIAKHSLAEEIRGVSAFSSDGRNLVHSPLKHESRIFDKFARLFTTPSNKIVVWDAVFEKVRARFETADVWVKSVACSPDNRYLATGLYDSTILIWDLQQLDEK